MKRRKPQRPPPEDNSRKSLRKQKRQLKKTNRHQHYTKTGAKAQPIVGRFVKRPPDCVNDVTISKNKKMKLIPSSHDLAMEERQRELKKQQRLQNEMDEQRKKMLLQANEEEDKLIKKLEKQLGMSKAKNKKNLFSGDGLDYLLEVCDRSTQEQLVAARKHLANVDAESDFEEDLAAVTGYAVGPGENKNNCTSKTSDDDDSLHEEEVCSVREEDDESLCEEDDEVDFDQSDDNNDASEEDDLSDPDIEDTEKYSVKRKQPIAPQTKSSKLKKEHYGTKSNYEAGPEFVSDDKNVDEDASESGSDDEDNEAAQVIEREDKIEAKPVVWEDIYGRKRDKEGNIIKEEKGTYIPPHMRNKDTSSQSLELIQLKRQIKGVLNKLAGTNLHWACSTVETLYGNSSRHSVNTALSDLWTDAVVQASATPDRMMAEHAALVSVLQANVGTEVGAHFLQVLVKQFDDMVSDEQPGDGKELENLTAALAYLYSFKIYQASLLYELLSRLLAEPSERRVGCVLAALRAVGGTLRRDQPLALKTFIQDTQSRLAALTHSAAVGSRIKFLLEVLMAVKNNNLNKIPNYDPSYSEDLKKMTRGIVRRGNYVTTLNIALDDLLKADVRGKWWVVGSAWEGSERERPAPTKAAPAADAKLLELARKQRMNTDIRRSIFCVIMSAQDYMDAFEKLQQLGLRNRQEREVVHVLLACCLQERSSNPYYAVLAQKLCDYDRKLQLSIQYAVWDKIKDLENFSKLQISNLAQFLIHLIMEKGLPLSVLKVIEFSDLSKGTVRFMRQILLAIIMNENLQSSLEVFQRISAAPKLHMFRESLRLFIQHFLVRNAGKKTNILSDRDMATLKERAQQVEKILSMNDSKLRL